MLGHKPRVAGIAHHASGYVLLLSLFTFLVSCASSPSAESTPAPPLILPQTPTPAPVLCYEAELPAALADESLSLFSAISSSDLIRGPADATTRFIIYGDYQDAASAEFHMLVKELAEKYPDALQVVFRDFPMFTLEGHEKAGLAAHAAQAAALQGKFWEMHDLLFEKQAAWTTLGYVAFVDWLVEEAQSFGVDGIVLKEDMQSQAVLDMVDQAYLSALDAGIPGTPFLLINGEIHDNLFNFYTFDRIIALNALAERQYTSCPPNVIEPEVEYLVSLKTEKGEVIIQLYPDEAPMAVNNFLFLVREGWYEGSSFHRVLPGYFAETGDFKEFLEINEKINLGILSEFEKAKIEIAYPTQMVHVKKT